MNNNVVLCRCNDYGYDEILKSVRTHFDSLDVWNYIEGKYVVIKPNLIRKVSFDRYMTTHPAIVKAVVELLTEGGASRIVIAESGAGSCNETTMKQAYRICGLENELVGTKAEFCTDPTTCEITYDNAKACKKFNVLKVFEEADVIINLAKLKTHGLTGMSAAVKNYFGTIAGFEKVEMHAVYSESSKFCDMICDLCNYFAHNKLTYNIVDAVIGMEGNGPTNGTPKGSYFIASSYNAHLVDRVCADVICKNDSVLVKKSVSETENINFEAVYIGLDKGYKVRYKDSDGKGISLKFLKGNIARPLFKAFVPKPYVVKDRCRQCGECVRSCPKNTVFIKEGNKFATIERKNCISCFCCQEVCPFNAIKIRKNPIMKLLK